MILVDWQITDLVEAGVVTNIEPENIQPTSLDVRLGKNILLDSPDGNYTEYDLSKYTSRDAPFFIKPNGFLLASTMEVLNLPHNISCSLKLKSSRARERLSHALAGHVESGFNGSLTLEIKNYSPFNDVPIWYGLRIGQLIFHQHKKVGSMYKGRYSGSLKPVQSLNMVDM
jgi:dCTP deaminase